MMAIKTFISMIKGPLKEMQNSIYLKIISMILSEHCLMNLEIQETKITKRR